jgi:hypothetical protein
VTFEERLNSIASHIDTLSQMQVETETRLLRLEEAGKKMDKRIDRVFSIVMKGGFDLSERLRKLEEDEANGKT